MAEIVNLGKVRKARQREAARVLAMENRARHARTKAQKENEEREAARREALLDNARTDEPEK